MSSSAIPVPGGPIAKRPLHFFWIADYSGSMAGKKIATLNQAIRDAIPALRQALTGHPEVAMLMRAIRFSDQADWHVGPNPVSIEQFVWPELSTAGGTSTAQALKLLASELTLEKMPHRSIPPVCLLVSDGFCTDPAEDYQAAIKAVLDQSWGIRAVRLAIAVGNPKEYSEEELLKFISHPEIGVLKADTPDKLINYIRWASVAVTVASVGKSKVSDPSDTDNPYVPLPPPPLGGGSGSGLDVF